MKATAELDILSEVKKVVESILKIPFEKIDVDAGFETFGMDSIIAMEFMTNLSQKFDIAITPVQFAEINTIKELTHSIEHILINEKSNVDAKEIEAEQEVSLPKDLSEPDYRQISQTSVSRRSRRNRGKKESFQELLGYINQKYSIDLTDRKFKTIDEVVEVLVSNHFDELMLHYDISKETDDKESTSERANLSIVEDITAFLQQVHDIAIIGMSCIFPDAPNPKVFWENLIAQKNSIREIPKSRWNWEDHYADSIAPRKTISKWGALIDDIDCFDPHFFNITQKEARLMDPQERLLMQEVYRAFQDAGIDIKKMSGSNTGVFIAYEYAEYEQYLRKNMNNNQIGPLFTSSSPTYYLANRLSYVFDFCGPSESININCSGSAVAINRAYYSLLNHECNLAIVGGVSLNLFVDDYIMTSQYGMLSPNGTCAVFDDNANGFTRGEGVAAIILKRLDDSERDNNRIYGIIKSCHQNNRGNARSLSEIKHESITSVISNCYEKVSIKPETISYIEVDGYSTKWGDSFEFEGIKKVFRNVESKEKYCALGCAKGNIGNVESVGGLASVIKLTLSLYNKKFPATISKKTMNTFIDIENPSHPLYIADSAILFDAIRQDNYIPIRAGANSFSDSGVNVHILLEEYIPEASITDREILPAQQLFILSAKDRNRLVDSVHDFIGFLSTADADVPYENIIYTVQIGREAMEERLAIIASSHTELLEKLHMVRNSGMQEQLGLEDQGIYYGNIEQTRKNSFMNLVTNDLINKQVELNLQMEQWQQVALLWINGIIIPWEKVWEDKPVKPVSLPSYPFAKERYWIDIYDNRELAVAASGGTLPGAKTDVVIESKNQSTMQPEWLFSTSSGNTKNMVSLGLAEKIELFLKQEIAWQLQIPIQQINTDQNFLELGLDSIGIASFIHKTIQLLQVNLSPSVVFNYSNIKKFSEYLVATYPEKIDTLIVTKQKQQVNTESNLIRSLPKQTNGTELAQLPINIEKGNFPPILPIDKEEFDQIPLSLAQERLFFLDQMEPDSCQNNIPLAVSISGELDISQLEQAFNLIVARHDSLRTVFLIKDGQIRQMILDSLDFKLECMDISHHKTEEMRQNKAKQICQNESATPFKLSKGPLFRGKIIKLAPKEHILTLNMHHIISDGWSMGILINELCLIMDALHQGKIADLPPLPIQYPDYVIWQRKWLEEGGMLKQRLAYWQEKLAGVPENLDLVTDYPRTAVQSLAGASHKFKLDTQLTQKLKNLAKQQGCTLYMTLLAAFNVLFYCYTGQEDICVGSVNANRDQFETAGLIGCFFNVVPIRSKLKGNKSFEQILVDTKNAMVEASNYKIPIEKIMEQLNAKRSAKIVNVLFNQLGPNDSTVLHFGTAEIKTYNYGQNESLNLSDLSIFIGIDFDTVSIELVYSQELFHINTIRKLELDFSYILQEVVNNSQAKIEEVINEINLYKRKLIHIISNYTIDPVLQLTDLVAKRLPSKPNVSIGGYNQIIQELLAINNDNATILVVSLMLEDCYKYKKGIKIAGKKKAVEDYIELLVAALTQNKAQSIILILHEILLEKIPYKQERAMLVKNRKVLLKEIEKIKTVSLIEEQTIDKQYPVETHKYSEIQNREGHIPFTDDYYIALGMSILRSYYHKKDSIEKKVIVLDCDNTLWRGIVGEEGVTGIDVPECYKQFQQQIKQKKGEGYLIALCSKNQEADVDAVFANRSEMVLKQEDIVLKKVNWEAKSQNIREIALELKIGLDSVVFIDDDPLEIEEVRCHCPNVLSLLLPQEKDRISTFIGDLWCFDKKVITKEDQQRTAMIKENIERQKLEQSLDYSSFIRQLDVKINITDMASDEVERVSQLTKRTNQFNAHKQEYSKAEIINYSRQSNHFIKTVKVKDKFGEYGLVGVMMYQKQARQIEVEQFLMSCRVLGREVEESMIKSLVIDNNIDKIAIKFSKSGCNQLVENFLEMFEYKKFDGSYEIQREAIITLKLGDRQSPARQEEIIPKPNDYIENIKANNARRDLDRRTEELFLMEMASEYRSVTQIKEKIKQFAKNNKRDTLKREYLAPRNNTEKQLATVWAEVLNKEPETIGVNDDFFQLGGNSFQALKLVTKIETQFKQSLPLTILFSARNIAALAKFILSEKTTAFDILVPIQTKGNKLPIFAVPGAQGTVVNLQPFSHALGDNQPFYGLQAVGLDGKTQPLDSIEKIAKANIAALKPIQTTGPYTLIGYSNGGVVAYEMARILLEQSDQIESLILLDSVSPLQRTIDVTDEIVEVCNSLIDALGGNLNLDAKKLQEVPENKRCEYLYNRMASQGFDVTKVQFTTYYNVMMASEQCCRAYRPSKLSHKIDVFLYRAIKGYQDMSNDYGWNQLLLKPVRIFDIKADHISIGYRDAIQKIAKKINLYRK